MNVNEAGHDILIVSSYDRMSASIKRALTDVSHRLIEVRKSAAMALRELSERDYDIAIINTPLSDGVGVDFAIDISEKYRIGVIIIATAETAEDIAERVTDFGIVVIAKPASVRAVSRSTRLLCALIDRLKGAEKKAQTLEEKMGEIRIINRAKWYLIEEKGMSEDEAHAYIGRLAMDKCITRGEAAANIIESR